MLLLVLLLTMLLEGPSAAACGAAADEACGLEGSKAGPDGSKAMSCGRRWLSTWLCVGALPAAAALGLPCCWAVGAAGAGLGSGKGILHSPCAVRKGEAGVSGLAGVEWARARGAN